MLYIQHLILLLILKLLEANPDGNTEFEIAGMETTGIKLAECGVQSF